MMTLLMCLVAAQDSEDGIELLVDYIRANPDAKRDDIMNRLEDYGI